MSSQANPKSKRQKHRKYLLTVFCAGLCCVFISLMLKSCHMENDQFNNVRSRLKPLNFSKRCQYPDAVNEYFQFYRLDPGSINVEHYFGTFESGSQVIAGHVYIPAEYKATVFALHGYFSHCGQLNKLIEYLVKQGYAVAAFDLPGLGLSSGERGSIDDFSQYGTALADFVEIVKEQLKGPYHFVGHSTGAAAALDILFTKDEKVFDRIVLAAPLVHCAAWEQTKIGYKNKIPFVKSVPRIFRKTSSDAEYLDFIRNEDPLQTKMVPLQWVKALHEWNERIADLPRREISLKVIQGTEDSTVDWEFNVDFIKEKFTDVDVVLVENANHELFNESDELRKEVFLQISSYLEKK